MSILNSIKKVLGVPADFTEYDVDILLFINGVLANLNQIGVGPDEGFQIEDAGATWEDFLGSDPRLNNVKNLVAHKVRLSFDPPSTSFAIQSTEALIKELETRIYIAREVEQWQDSVVIVQL